MSRPSATSAPSSTQTASRTTRGGGRTPLHEQTGKVDPFDVPEQEAALNLIRTGAVLSTFMTRLFKPHGLTDSSYNVLRILRGAAPDLLRCSDIRDRLVVPVPDVTRLVDRLEVRALVERQTDEVDHRVVRVSITRKGRQLLDRLDGPLLEMHQHQLGHLSAKELAQLSTLLTKARSPHEPEER